MGSFSKIIKRCLNLRTMKLGDFETLKPRNQDTKTPRNPQKQSTNKSKQATKTRHRETKKATNQDTDPPTRQHTDSHTCPSNPYRSFLGRLMTLLCIAWLIDGITRYGIVWLINGITWLVDGITWLMNGITRLINGWGPGRSRHLPPPTDPLINRATP